MTLETKLMIAFWGGLLLGYFLKKIKPVFIRYDALTATQSEKRLALAESSDIIEKFAVGSLSPNDYTELDRILKVLHGRYNNEQRQRQDRG